jgi:hypothetical protein
MPMCFSWEEHIMDQHSKAEPTNVYGKSHRLGPKSEKGRIIDAVV